MKHVDILLPDYIQGRLAEEEEIAVERHLESCPACRDEEKEMRALFEHLEQQPGAAVTDRYFQTLLPRIRLRLEIGKKKHGIAWELINRLVFPLGVGVAAILLVVRLTLESPSDRGGLSSTLDNLETTEVFDALVEQSFRQPWGPPVVQKMDELVTANVLAEGLMQRIDDVDFYSPATLFNGTAIELSERDADVLLQRLNERKIL